MLSRISIAAGLAVCLGAIVLISPATLADDAPASARSASAAQPWVADQELAKTVWADIQSGGILGVASHVAEMEKALANARQSIDAARANKDPSFVLTDGTTDVLIQLAAAATDKSRGAVRVVAVDNPYPTIAFFLGSYYNEIGKFDDAVRVLDEGLASSGALDMGIGVGAHEPALLSEKGAALVGLKRWADALAAYDAAMKIDGLDGGMRAHILRGRGFALTELGRLEEATQAYNDSLKLEPGNARAQRELQYIAGLRAGDTPTATSLAPVQPQSVPATPASASAPAPTPN